MEQNATTWEAATRRVSSRSGDGGTRRPYTSPQIVPQGTVEELTQAIGGPGDDALGGSQPGI